MDPTCYFGVAYTFSEHSLWVCRKSAQKSIVSWKNLLPNIFKSHLNIATATRVCCHQGRVIFLAHIIFGAVTPIHMPRTPLIPKIAYPWHLYHPSLLHMDYARNTPYLARHIRRKRPLLHSLLWILSSLCIPQAILGTHTLFQCIHCGFAEYQLKNRLWVEKIYYQIFLNPV